MCSEGLGWPNTELMLRGYKKISASEALKNIYEVTGAWGNEMKSKLHPTGKLGRAGLDN